MNLVIAVGVDVYKLLKESIANVCVSASSPVTIVVFIPLGVTFTIVRLPVSRAITLLSVSITILVKFIPPVVKFDVTPFEYLTIVV